MVAACPTCRSDIREVRCCTDVPDKDGDRHVPWGMDCVTCRDPWHDAAPVTVTFLDAARELARARERLDFLRNAAPQTVEDARRLGDEKIEASRAVRKAEAELDQAYRIEEYGEVVK